MITGKMITGVGLPYKYVVRDIPEPDFDDDDNYDGTSECDGCESRCDDDDLTFCNGCEQSFCNCTRIRRCLSCQRIYCEDCIDDHLYDNHTILIE